MEKPNSKDNASIDHSITYMSFSSVATLNYLPIIGQAIQLVAEVLFSGLSDYFGVRLPFLLLHSVSTSLLNTEMVHPNGICRLSISHLSSFLLYAQATNTLISHDGT